MIETSLFSWLSIFVITVWSYEVPGETLRLHKVSPEFTNFISPSADKGYLDNIKSRNIARWLWINKVWNIDRKIQFQLFNELVPNGVIIKRPDESNSTNFLLVAPIKFIIHGWLSSGNGNICQSIKTQYLNNYKFNIIIVHWELASSYVYMFVVYRLKYISQFITDFVEELVKTEGLDHGSIHIIGHSLGAHIAGHVGKMLKSRRIWISRITGLDPAYLGFQDFLGFEKLSKEAAAYVDVVHTTGGSLGLFSPLGHVDYYPNGGRHPMPGCERDWVQKRCSHSRSWQYFSESIAHPFPAVRCKTNVFYHGGECSKQYVYLGEHFTMGTRGKFYFETNYKSPFNLGCNGAALTRTYATNQDDQSIESICVDWYY